MDITRLAKIFAAAVFFVAIFAGSCFAGAWTLQKGILYDRLALNYYYADTEFDDDGNRKDFTADGEFKDINLSNYIGFGLTDEITLINSVYYKNIKKEDDFTKTKTYGIGDIDLGVRYKIAEGSWGIFSTQALLKIPAAYDKDDDLPLGNGQYDMELRLLYGRSLYPYVPGYCNFEIGYRWRFEDPSDEVRYLIEFGMDFTNDVYGRIKLDGIYSMDNGEHFDTGGNPTTANNFDLGKLDIALGLKISKRFGVELGYTPEIYGQDTASGATYTFALTYKTP